MTSDGSLVARDARNGAPLVPNTITVAPPDRYLRTVAGRVHLGDESPVRRHRSSVDVMFGSAARWAGPDLVAVVLSGTLDDGAAGAALVAQAGGTVVVQDLAEATYAGMPRAVLATVPTARAVPMARMAAMLTARWSAE